MSRGDVVILANRFELPADWRHKRLRQDRHAIFRALAISNEHDASLEVDVLEAKPQCFHQSKPAAIHKRCNQPVRALELIEHQSHFGSGQNYREALRARCAYHATQPRHIRLQHAFVQKQNCGQGLCLRSRRHMAFAGQMRQECLDLSTSKLSRMPTAVEDYETSNPANILLFSAITIVAHAKCFPNQIQQARFSGHAV